MLSFRCRFYQILITIIALGSALYWGMPHAQAARGNSVSRGPADADNVELIGHWGDNLYTALEASGDRVYVYHDPYLTIADCSDPSEYVVLGKTSLTGTPADMILSGDYLYLACGLHGLIVMDVGDPANPAEVGSYDVGDEASGLDIRGDYAYVAAYYNGLRVIDISTPSSPAEVGYYDTPNRARDVAIYGDYACVADWSAGLRIIDITTPSSPAETGFCAIGGGVTQVIVNTGGTAYVADTWDGQIYAIDIRTPGSPSIMSFCGVGSSDIDISSDYIFVAGDDEGFCRVDISNPWNIIRAGCQATVDEPMGVSISGTRAYVADNGGGLRIMDITTPSSPTEIGSYDDVPFRTRRIALDGDYAYVADWVDGLRVIDVSTPSEPVAVALCKTTHWAYDVAISGGYAYVADYFAGLRAFDISVPTNPVEIGFYDEPDGSFNGIRIAGDHAYISENFSVGTEGNLRVIDISTPSNPAAVGQYAIWDWPRNLAVSGSLAYLACGDAGLQIIDVSTPSSPTQIGYYNTADHAYGVDFEGNYAYVADDWDGLRVYDVSTPSSPVEVGFYDMAGDANYVTVSGGYAYVGLKNNRMQVIDVSVPSSPTRVGYFDIDGQLFGITVFGGYIYLACGYRGMSIVEYDSPALGTTNARSGGPSALSLAQNVPNPFNPSTSISFELPELALVELLIYDVEGRLVKTLVKGIESAGVKTLSWDGRDDKGNPVASGVYVYKLQAGKQTLSRKMTLLR